ncbi:MAG: type II secretion system F family protein [Mariprofundaceae bacterium]|nr:type II secretion system F family protein [Mariprofundaceae bacterium]
MADAPKTKLHTFTWKAKTRQGEAKEGSQEARDKGVVLASLRRQRYVDIKVSKKTSFDMELFAEKVTPKDISIFLRQLSTMLNAGLPLVQCFELAEKGTEKKSMGTLLTKIREGLEAGGSLGGTLRQFPQEFDTLSCALVEAGEQGGILDTILLRLCGYKEKSLALQAKIKSAMTYPIAIIAISFIVTSILMIFVIPMFAEMFSSMGQALPLPTQIVLTLSNGFVDYWYIVLALPFAVVSTIKAIYRTPQGQYQLDNLQLNLPIFGDILRKGAVARFCSTFSTLSSAGVPILETLDTVSQISGNVVLERVIINAKESIMEGHTLSEPLEKSGVFPLMVTQMISIGEATGSMEDMMAKIADFYEEEVETAVDGLSQLIEPVIMAFLGIVIGGLVIAMYLPIFQMASGL